MTGGFLRVRARDRVDEAQAPDRIRDAHGADAVDARIRVGRVAGVELAARADDADGAALEHPVEPEHEIARDAEHVVDAERVHALDQVAADRAGALGASAARGLASRARLHCPEFTARRRRSTFGRWSSPCCRSTPVAGPTSARSSPRKGADIARNCGCMYYRRSGPPPPVPKGKTRGSANLAALKGAGRCRQDARPDRVSRQGPGRMGRTRAARGVRAAEALVGDEARRRQAGLVDHLLRGAARVSRPGRSGRRCSRPRSRTRASTERSLLEAYPVDQPRRSH